MRVHTKVRRHGARTHSRTVSKSKASGVVQFGGSCATTFIVKIDQCHTLGVNNILHSPRMNM